MARYVVTAVGVDRPGVVAALSGVLVEQRCNLEDSQMAVLGGHAAMMLVVHAPHSVTGERLQGALTEGTGQLGLAIWVQPIVDVGAPQQAGGRWLVSVYGADRPGIVFEVTRLLARAGINITGLQTRLLDRVCALSMEVTVPAGCDGNQVSDQLDRLADQLGMACSMRPQPEHPRT